MIRAILLTAVLVGATACGTQPSSTARPSDPRVDVASAVRGGPIVCGTDGVHSAPTQVRARVDGVHLRFRNTWKQKLRYRLILADGREDGSIPPGTSTAVMPIPPGDMLVTCMVRLSTRGPGAMVQVIDPLGHSVGVRLACSTPNSTFVSIAGNAKGEKDVVAATRRVFARGLRDGDVVRELDYVRDGRRAVIVEQGDRVLARADFFPAERGGWLLESFGSCGDFKRR